MEGSKTKQKDNFELLLLDSVDTIFKIQSMSNDKKSTEYISLLFGVKYHRMNGCSIPKTYYLKISNYKYGCEDLLLLHPLHGHEISFDCDYVAFRTCYHN